MNLIIFFKLVFNYFFNPQVLSTVGIFRVSGNRSEIEQYRLLFNEGKPVIFKCSAFEVAGLLKEFLRSLPEPLIPAFWNSQIPLILEHKQNQRQFFEDLKFVITTLPRPNYIIFRFFVMIFSMIVSYSEKNMMTVDNIIKCFAPNMGCYPALFSYPISNVKYFFGDNPPEDSSPKRASLLRSVSTPDIYTKIKTEY